MEKKLAIYREKLIIQNIFMALGVGALLAVQFIKVEPSYTGHYGDFYRGFVAGAAAGVCVILIVWFIRNLIAISSGERLKAAYIKAKDERTEAMYTNGRALGTSIFLLASIPAMIIAGYFSAAVLFTMMACTFSLSVICGVCKLYYSHKL